MRLLIRKSAVFVGLAIAALLAIPTSAGANPNPNLSCRASALRATILGLKLEPVVANPTATACNNAAAGLLQYGPLLVPQIKAGVLNAKTVATESTADASASVAKVAITIAGLPAITADILTSSADLTCVNGEAVMTGTADVAKVTIGSLVIQAPVGPATFNLGIGTLYLNESTQTSDKLTERALHLVVPGIAEVVVAESIVDVHDDGCAGSQPPPPPPS